MDHKYAQRKQAGEILKNEFGFGSPRLLARVAVLGNGPEYFIAGRTALYDLDKLREWARSYMGAAACSSMAHQFRRETEAA